MKTEEVIYVVLFLIGFHSLMYAEYQGKVRMEGGLGLLRDMKKQGVALSCCSYPRSDIVAELQV